MLITNLDIDQILNRKIFNDGIMEEIHRREAIDEFNRPIKLKDIYEIR
jgi:hypothetical protein